MPRLMIEGREAQDGATLSIHHQGIMTVRSAYFGPGGEMPPKKDGAGKRPPRQRTIVLTRTLFPSTTGQFVLERLNLKNESDRSVKVELEQTSKAVRTNPARGVYGEYVIESRTLDAGERNLKPGESTTYSVAFTGRKASDPEPRIDPAAEEDARRQLVASYLSQLVLETPDPVLNAAFGFAKIRATESIYETKGGLMHGPAEAATTPPSGPTTRPNMRIRSSRFSAIPREMHPPSTRSGCSQVHEPRLQTDSEFHRRRRNELLGRSRRSR